MEQQTVIVQHRQYLRLAVFGIVPVIVLTLFLILQPGIFVIPYGPVIIIAVMAMNLLLCVWFAFFGLSEERLDAKGITFKTPLGTKQYPWAAIESYGIDTVRTKQGTVPRFCLSFREETRRAVLEYREDVGQCLRHYRGQPAYNKWEESK